jgi:hypothetical protein
LNDQPASFFTNSTAIVALLSDAYFTCLAKSNSSIKYQSKLGLSTTTDIPLSRKLLQATGVDPTTLSSLTTVFTSVASSISSSNAVMQNVITLAKTALATQAADPNAALPDLTAAFTQATQVAQVQGVQLSAQVESVAGLVQSGQALQAAVAAQSVQQQFSGTALVDAIAAAQINTAAVSEAGAPATTPTASPPVAAPSPPAADSSSSSKSVVGAAVGGAVGGAAGVALLVGAALLIKAKMAGAAVTPGGATTPASTA